MINKVILIGKLQEDAATKTTTNDKQMTKLVVRTSENYKKDGETKWQNEYHNCKLFGEWVVSTGLIDRLKKDTDVYVEGKLTSYSYEDKNGQTRYMTEIIVETLRIV
jgi:single-strand DNA-binding protein